MHAELDYDPKKLSILMTGNVVDVKFSLTRYNGQRYNQQQSVSRRFKKDIYLTLALI